ncbi:MAG: Molybdenum ABC transporter permease protein ModB, partial [uncultured Nocardioidaceae bacterium]
DHRLLAGAGPCAVTAARPGRCGDRAARRAGGRARAPHPLARAARAARRTGAAAGAVDLGAHRHGRDAPLRGARPPPGLGAGPHHLPRTGPRPGARRGAAGDATGGRGRRAPRRLRSHRCGRRAAARPLRRDGPVHHRRGGARPHVRRAPVLRAQRRGCAARRQPGLRQRGRHPRRQPLDDLPAGHSPARAAGDRRRDAPVLGPRHGRVRRHDHVRRELPRDHPDDAAAHLQPAAERPRRGVRARPRPPGLLLDRARRAARPLAPRGTGM